MASPPLATARTRSDAALKLAARLPELLVAARRIAANVMLGVHGRRHPGSGETFWQFRPYGSGEPIRQIDWRRSARDDHLYVREREWEASQTVWLWADLSPSMDFRSRLSQTTKLDRAVVLMLALADMLGRGGERVGLPGLAEPRIGRDAADRLAEVLAHAALTDDWPRLDRVARFSEVVILSDFLADLETTRARLRALAGRGAGMHLLQVFDPAEETFPYEGRLEFRDPESGATWLTERAGGLRADYRGRLEAHRALLRSFARAAGSSFAVHHTDRPAVEGLLFLQSRLSGIASYTAPRGDVDLERPGGMIGSLGFLSPWLIVGLAALPLIWLILRLTPPRPRQVEFPPTRLLMELQDRERTPARTPWWLTLLRLALAALIILALAEPILRPELKLTAGQEPLLVVLDNGWDTAPDFVQRAAAAGTAIAEADRDGRPVAFLATAEPRAENLAAETAQAARQRLAAIVPRPFLPDRPALATRLAQTFGERSVEVVWVAGSVDDGNGAAFAAALNRIAVRGSMLQSSRPVTMMRTPENRADGVHVPLVRFGGAGDVGIGGFDQDGRRILEGTAALGADGTGAAEIALPAEIRNALVRFRITGESTAGAVQLLDARWQRKSVGLIAGEGADESQPLLDPLTYVQRALAPTSDLIPANAPSTSEAVTGLIDRGASVIVLTETGTLPPDTSNALVQWVENGGTLIRFASPNLAATTVDTLLPVRIRQGEREIGGSLSWEEPQPVGSFPADGPFAHIPVPTDVTVNRQVLADPDALRDAEVWAELRDGTPLVTAASRGKGRIVLFHVTADPRWSNLPLSGAFVSMLNAIVDMAGTVRQTAEAKTAGAAQVAAAPWKPVEVLDGYGNLAPPPAGATLVADIEEAKASPQTPPGLYDRDGTIFALNTLESDSVIAPLVPTKLGWQGSVRTLEPQPATPIWPWLLAAAAVLAILDGLAVLALSGRMTRRFASAAVLALAGALLLPAIDSARAQDHATEMALAATSKTQLAYVITGNSDVDATSKAGLSGLSIYLADRTALEPGQPAAVDIATDELAFYALIYWPIDPGQPTPSAETMARVDTFMKNGGTILFDTRDAGGFSTSGTDTPEAMKLREILSFVDVPPLEPVPPDHVLTKAFYLLSEFPGRWANSELWVESLSDQPQDANRPARGGDGVSPIIITGNDLAAAWAVDDSGLWLHPTVPSDPRQRELAFRAGVNIVMYALTGNYKADQVHVPALLERLGQ